MLAGWFMGPIAPGGTGVGAAARVTFVLSGGPKETQGKQLLVWREV